MFIIVRLTDQITAVPKLAATPVKLIFPLGLSFLHRFFYLAAKYQAELLLLLLVLKRTGVALTTMSLKLTQTKGKLKQEELP
jgi:hypothetical protein